jgi:hypothetical protein
MFYFKVLSQNLPGRNEESLEKQDYNRLFLDSTKVYPQVSRLSQ